MQTVPTADTPGPYATLCGTVLPPHNTHLWQGDVLLCFQVKLCGISIAAPHTFDCTRVGLNVDDVADLQKPAARQQAACVGGGEGLCMQQTGTDQQAALLSGTQA